MYTIMIYGSDGEVMAPFGRPGVFYPGKWVKIKVTKVSQDMKTPLIVREALVGLEVDTIFTVEQTLKHAGTDFGLPAGTRLAYAQDVIKTLSSNRKKEAAKELKGVAGGELDMYTLEPGIFIVVD